MSPMNMKQHHQGVPSERSEQQISLRAVSDWFGPTLGAPLPMETHEQVGECYSTGGFAASAWDLPQAVPKKKPAWLPVCY